MDPVFGYGRTGPGYTGSSQKETQAKTKTVHATGVKPKHKSGLHRPISVNCPVCDKGHKVYACDMFR